MKPINILFGIILAVLLIASPSLAQNNLSSQGVAAGSDPSLRATGSDTNLNAVVYPKGTGGMILRNDASGNVDLSLRDYADTADDDMAHTLLRTNCTTATTGAEDCDFTISVPEAGAAVDARFTIDADGDITIGSATTDDVDLISTGNRLQNASSGNVDLSFRDYADTTDDDQEHAIIRSNCTTATTGAEDCDLTLMVATGGAAPAALITLDADGNGASQGGVNIILRHGATPPATCTVGEIFLDTDETDDTNCTTTADNSICICAATDTWATTE